MTKQKQGVPQLFDLVDAAYNAHEVKDATFEAQLLTGAKLIQADKEPEAVRVLYDALAALTSEQRLQTKSLTPLLATVQMQLAKNRQTIGTGLGLAYIGSLF